MNIFAQLEALLFNFGEALDIKKIASLLNISNEECEKAIGEWAAILANDPARGLTLLRKENKVQLVTKVELKSIAELIVKDEFREQLTPAALETLSLIAYLGPVPRATIDYIRGVNSSFTLRALVMRGLVERCDEKGLSFKYRVTEQFMKHMGLASLTELPEHEKYKEILRQFEEQLQSVNPQTPPAIPETPAEPAL
jgi:segregation and condensation protein B